LPGIFGQDQCLQQIVQIPLNPFAQHEAVVAREFTRVIARPQNQVIRLGDDDQFLGLFPVSHAIPANSVQMNKMQKIKTGPPTAVS
jgi:hypothetical protein